MIRKRFRRRPELESLETMVLLSGLSVLEHPGVVAIAAQGARPDATTVLLGAARGTYKLSAGGTSFFSAKGLLSPLGKVALKGSIDYGVASPSGTATFKSVGRKHGTITASLTTAGSGSPVFYSITGSTGTYAGDTGSGEATFVTVPAKGRGPSHGKVTITFTQISAG